MAMLTLELEADRHVRTWNAKSQRFNWVPAKDLVKDLTIKIAKQKNGGFRLMAIADVQRMANKVILQLRILPSIRKNTDILMFADKARDFFSKNEKIRFRTPALKLDESIQGRDHIHMVIARKSFSGRRATCGCCGNDINHGEFHLEINLHSRSDFIDSEGNGRKTITKHVHYHDCMTDYQAWKVAVKRNDIKTITREDLEKLNPTAYSTALEFQSGWVALTNNGRYFEYANNVPELLRIYRNAKSRNIRISKVCRMARASLNGENTMSCIQARSLAGLSDSDMDAIHQTMKKSGRNAHVIVAEHKENGSLFLRYCKDLDDARTAFYEVRSTDDIICYGFLSKFEVDNDYSSRRQGQV